MLLSEVLKNSNFQDYSIRNEQEFDTLALCGSQISEKFCTFVSEEKYLKDLSENATMVIVPKEVAEIMGCNERGIVIVENPRNFFFELHNYLCSYGGYAREFFETKIPESAEISDMAYISKNNVIIGEEVIIEPFVTIYPNVVIGSHTIVRSGSRIGGEGFEFKRTKEGIMSVKHAGGVVIGEHVEIQNNSCIDKAIYPWDNTILGNYVKTDNMVHVAHAVKVGDNTLLVAQIGIGGRTVIGKNSWIGFGATIRNGITIGDNARANMGAVVTKSIPDNGAVTGNFAIEHSRFMRHLKEQSMEDEKK